MQAHKGAALQAFHGQSNGRPERSGKNATDVAGLPAPRAERICPYLPKGGGGSVKCTKGSPTGVSGLKKTPESDHTISTSATPACRLPRCVIRFFDSAEQARPQLQVSNAERVAPADRPSQP